jgi:hypothetical protein
VAWYGEVRRTGLFVVAAFALAVAASSAARSVGGTWEGTWNTNFGVMTLLQTGNHVTGTYTYSGGSIDGTAAGNTLTGTWAQKGNGAHGKFVFMLSADGNSWTGLWGSNNETPTRTNWSGKRAQPAPVRWSVRAYANNVKVLPPLVGKFQLGTFSLNGSGTLSSDGTAAGTLSDVDHLTQPVNTLFVDMKVVSSKFSVNGLVKTLTLTVQITNADHVHKECPVGLKGTVVLISNPAKLSNGQNSDAFTETWAGACGHVHGTHNRDAGARTSPPTGGPPNGGQWAIVAIS